MRMIFLSLALLATAPAFADDVEILIPEVTEVDFEGVDVNASIDGPDIIVVSETRRPVIAPFITLRSHFSPEMKASLSAF